MPSTTINDPRIARGFSSIFDMFSPAQSGVGRMKGDMLRRRSQLYDAQAAQANSMADYNAQRTDDLAGYADARGEYSDAMAEANLPGPGFLVAGPDDGIAGRTEEANIVNAAERARLATIMPRMGAAKDLQAIAKGGLGVTMLADPSAYTGDDLDRVLLATGTLADHGNTPGGFTADQTRQTTEAANDLAEESRDNKAVVQQKADQSAAEIASQEKISEAEIGQKSRQSIREEINKLEREREKLAAEAALAERLADNETKAEVKAAQKENDAKIEAAKEKAKVDIEIAKIRAADGKDPDAPYVVPGDQMGILEGVLRQYFLAGNGTPQDRVDNALMERAMAAATEALRRTNGDMGAAVAAGKAVAWEAEDNLGWGDDVARSTGGGIIPQPTENTGAPKVGDIIQEGGATWEIIAGPDGALAKKRIR